MMLCYESHAGHGIIIIFVGRPYNSRDLVIAHGRCERRKQALQHCADEHNALWNMATTTEHSVGDALRDGCFRTSLSP